MREIKFRAWDKENKHMLYDSSDGVLECGEGQHEDVLNIWLDGTIEITNCERNYFPNGIGTINDSEKRFILQQYTGAKDAKSREIYEGDIIAYGDCVYKVIYAEGRAGFWCVFDVYTRELGINSGEVIGNIYANPELLDPDNPAFY